MHLTKDDPIIYKSHKDSTHLLPEVLRLAPYSTHFITHAGEQDRHQLVMIWIPEDEDTRKPLILAIPHPASPPYTTHPAPPYTTSSSTFQSQTAPTILVLLFTTPHQTSIPSNMAKNMLIMQVHEECLWLTMKTRQAPLTKWCNGRLGKHG